MPLRDVGLVVALAGAVAVGACSPRPSTAESDAAPPASGGAAAPADLLTQDDAIRRAREFVAQHPAAAAAVYLDSAQATAVDSLWRVTFRRRALVLPAVLTVDVHRRTGALRFAGDE